MTLLTDNHEIRSFTCASCGFTFAAPLNCGNRFCEICGQPRRRRIKAKLNAIIEARNPGERNGIKLLTLTIPNVQDIRYGYNQLKDSFRRLRQRQWWRNRCKGGAWIIEVTGTPGKWHVHLHALLESRFLPHDMLARLWSQVSPGTIVHIKRIPVKSAVGYVTKYVSKSEVDAVHQLHVSTALKGCRIFNVFGKWHAAASIVRKVNYCCPECDYEGFYMNGLGYSPEEYGARAPPGTFERTLRDKVVSRRPLPPSLPAGSPSVTIPSFD